MIRAQKFKKMLLLFVLFLVWPVWGSAKAIGLSWRRTKCPLLVGGGRLRDALIPGLSRSGLTEVLRKCPAICKSCILAADQCDVGGSPPRT